jgi:hypothetical protein
MSRKHLPAAVLVSIGCSVALRDSAARLQQLPDELLDSTQQAPRVANGRDDGSWLALGGSELERGPQLLQVEKRPRFHRRRPYCALQIYLVDPALRIEVPTRFGLVAAHDLSSSAVRRSMKVRTTATMTFSAAVQARLNRRCRLTDMKGGAGQRQRRAGSKLQRHTRGKAWRIRLRPAGANTEVEAVESRRAIGIAVT